MAKRKGAAALPPAGLERRKFLRANLGMVEYIVGRRNVFDPVEEMADDIIAGMPSPPEWAPPMVRRMVRFAHRRARRQYAMVMGGRY